MNSKGWVDINKCKKCSLHKYRRKIVIGKGRFPADVLFIGEAPGKSEDLRGTPFSGPSGKLFERALEIVFDKLKSIPTYYITNTVLCRPCDKKGGPNRAPSKEEILTCKQNILKIIYRVNPYETILLGKVAENAFKSLDGKNHSLQHPAYILRRGGVKSPEFRIFCRKLHEILKGIKKKHLVFRGN